MYTGSPLSSLTVQVAFYTSQLSINTSDAEYTFSEDAILPESRRIRRAIVDPAHIIEKRGLGIDKICVNHYSIKTTWLASYMGPQKERARIMHIFFSESDTSL